MTTLRPYQAEAVAAVNAYWIGGGGNALVDLPTGTGKSVVLAQIIRDYAEGFGARVIVLTHVKELVEQDLRQTLRLWPACPAGINSAGLGRRDTRAQVLFVSIQSVHRLGPDDIGVADIVIIDEAHLVPADGDGMYLKWIARMREANPEMRVVGLTATPYRLDSGRLDRGKARIFDETVYSYGLAEAVADGFLAPLRARNGAAGQIDAAGVAKRGGEFVAGALEKAANTDALVRAAVADMIGHGAERQGWIVFASGVDHCEAVRAELARHGVACASVTGETERGERDRAIRDFKARQLRALVSVGVLTTGFDAPHVDMIALLRPTLSTGLYVQMLGRGTRLCEGKRDCLVLDYAGNVRRHGPVDAVEIKKSGGAVGEAEEPKVKEYTIRAKECPACQALVSVRTMECADCGHLWPVEPKHEAKADTNIAVMSSEIAETWLAVDRITAAPHTSQAGNLTLRIDYLCGLKSYSEWLQLDNSGWGREKAAHWWRRMTGEDAIPDVTRAAAQLEDGESVIDVTAIRVAKDGKFWRILDRLRSDGRAVDDKMRVRVVDAPRARAA